MWRYKYLSSDYNADSNTGDLNNLVQFKMKKKKNKKKQWNHVLPQVWTWQYSVVRALPDSCSGLSSQLQRLMVLHRHGKFRDS